MTPCESHFDSPAVVYKKGDPTCIRVDKSTRYEHKHCDICNWEIATYIKREQKVVTPAPVSYSGKVVLPEKLRLSFNKFEGHFLTAKESQGKTTILKGI